MLFSIIIIPFRNDIASNIQTCYNGGIDGQKLFRRLGNKYVLTYAGERYVEKAGQILQLKADLDMELADIIKRDVGVLKVAFPTMRCTYMLPCTLPAFQQLYPKLEVSLLKNEQLIMMLPTQRTGQIVNDYLRHKGLHFERVIYTSNMPAIIDLVAESYGVAFVFEPHLRHRSFGRPIDCYSFGEPRMVSNFASALSLFTVICSP